MRPLSFAVGSSLLILTISSPVQSSAARVSTPLACSLANRKLTADLPRGRIDSGIYSIVFNARDSRGDLLFQEIIPIMEEQVFRISTLPMNVDGNLSQVSHVECQVAPGLGNASEADPSCAFGGHVDMGIEVRVNVVRVNVIEASGQKVFINVTATRLSDGVSGLEPFDGESLFFRSVNSGGTLARVLLFGPSPTSVAIGANLTKNAHLYELGAGAGEDIASVAVCL